VRRCEKIENHRLRMGKKENVIASEAKQSNVLQ